jgi:gamma-glutamylcyclotransferase (GGCT)/AIG2-like uncharacterized protein YtfP
MENETFLFFTYGTLMKGERNEHLLKGARYVGKAVTKPKYNLFRIDGNFTFPAIVDEGELAVKGEVYEVPVSALPGMDRMEGHPHFYCRKPIELADDFVGEVLAYFFVDKDSLPKRHPQIKTGDWLNR